MRPARLAATLALSAVMVPGLPLALPVAAQEAPMLSVVQSEAHGPYLVGPDDRPVYAFVTEDVRGGNEITPLLACQERCLDDWQLVTLPAPDVFVGEGVDPVLAEPLDWMGELILIYDSRAMFHYHRDEPGAPPKGQQIHEWGGWWYLVRPDGTPIDTGIAPEVPD